MDADSDSDEERRAGVDVLSGPFAVPRRRTSAIPPTASDVAPLSPHAVGSALAVGSLVSELDCLGPFVRHETG